MIIIFKINYVIKDKEKFLIVISMKLVKIFVMNVYLVIMLLIKV